MGCFALRKKKSKTTFNFHLCLTVHKQVKCQNKTHQENRAGLKCLTNLLVTHHKVNDNFWSKFQMLLLQVVLSNKYDLVRDEFLWCSSCGQAKPFLSTVYSPYLIFFPFLFSVLFHSSAGSCLENHGVHL